MRYLSLIIVIFILGCTTEITLNQEMYVPKIVVDGWIEPNEPAVVFLTQSSPFLTQYDSISIVKSFINHAKVSLYSSSGEEEVLTLFKIKDHFPPYVYKSTQITGAIGQSYTLKVEYSGNVLIASTTIPQPPEIKSILFREYSQIDGSLIVRYIPKDINSIYYLFQTASKRSQLWPIPAYYPIHIYDSSKYVYADYEIFYGRENNISDIGIHKTPVDSVGPRHYGIKDTVIVSVSALDIQSFEVLNSIFFNLSNYDNPFTVPNPPITNINGGVGRWTGLGTTKVVFIPSVKVKNYVPDK